MLSYLEAQQIIAQYAHSYGSEEIDLDEALGRVLSEKIFADRDYPPFNRSAMDGFAIRQEDFQNGIRFFKIVDTVFAGKTTDKKIGTGECYKIMTGAAVPPSANAVVRIEDSEIKEETVSITINEVKPFQNIARKGEDLLFDTLVLHPPHRINASIIGLLATLGKSKLRVEKLPTVAIITTGDEVVSVNEKANAVQIRNSNLAVIKALFKKWGITPSFTSHIPDQPDVLQKAIQKALDYDLIVLSGGVSAGDADYVPEVLRGLGVEKLFHKLAIKPGKPIWCGHFNKKKIVFALPGNPFSCLVTFTLFIQTYLQACFGLTQQTISLPLQKSRQKKVALDEFFPVTMSGTPAGISQVGLNGSGDIRLAFEATALALHGKEKGDLETGQSIPVYFL